MEIKQPKDSSKYSWTRHVYDKMRHYKISEQMVRRVIRNPERVEEGVAPETIAVMQSRGTKQKHEIWVMYQLRRDVGVNSKSESRNPKQRKIRVITTWRYPGTSPKRAAVPIPQDIIEELNISYDQSTSSS